MINTGLQSSSPGDKASLVSFFDFIIAANGVPILANDRTFIDLITQSKGVPMKLLVYNYKMDAVRECTITPDSGWGGNGLLGITIRFDCYEKASENVVHVLVRISRFSRS